MTKTNLKYSNNRPEKDYSNVHTSFDGDLQSNAAVTVGRLLESAAATKTSSSSVLP